MATLANAIGRSGVQVRGPELLAVYPEAASQTFTGAHFVNLSSGLLQMGMTAHATNNLGQDSYTDTTTRIFGKPMEDATGVTRTALPIQLAMDNVLFSIPVWYTSDSSTNVRQREGILGGGYGVGNRTANAPDSTAANVTNTWVLDTSYTTYPKAMVVGFVTRDGWVTPGREGVAWSSTSGEKYGHVWCKIIASSRGVG